MAVYNLPHKSPLISIILRINLIILHNFEKINILEKAVPIMFLLPSKYAKKVGTEKDFIKANYDFSSMEHFGEKNALNIIPIIEWYWEPERIGVFENQINELDNINLMVKKIVYFQNIIANTDAILHNSLFQ